MTRSFPEKTFEHWCSIHLTYRYRSHLRMWWPTSTADIVADASPRAIGKRLWLELKTTEWKPANGGRHELPLDLEQLDKYAASGPPDYYVFPRPTWRGVLGDADSAIWLRGLDRSDLTYQSHAREKWFAVWTTVVSGRELRARLATEIAQYKAGVIPESFVVARIRNGTTAWTTPTLRAIRSSTWKAFWERMERCGSAAYPAQFVTPPGAVAQARPSHAQLVAAMTNAQAGGGVVDDAAIFSPTGDGVYARVPSDQALGTTDFEWSASPSRALVTLTRAGLKLG